MASSRVTSELVRALISAAQEGQCVPQVVADVLRIQEVVRNEQENVVSFLTEAAIPFAERQRVVREAWGQDIHVFVLHALLLLQERDAAFDLDLFADQVVTCAREMANHHEVTVKSAIPLTDEERERLRMTLQHRLGGTHRMHERTEPGLLGGLRLEFGHIFIDASVHGRLERLRQSLA